MHAALLSKTIMDFKIEGRIPRLIVEDVLDFNILIEPDELETDETIQVEAWVGDTVEKGLLIIREYGRQIEPPSLGRLQMEFYSFTNSIKYRQSMQTISVARAVLNQAWEGLNGWVS